MFDGPQTEIAQHTHTEKYKQKGETWEEFTYRLANGLKDSDEHYHALTNIIGNQRFLFAGRIQSSIGSARQTTAFNCYVSMTIPDSMNGIMQALSEAAETMRMGGGIGYDFSTLRPRGTNIKSLQSSSSGPVSFMEIYNAMCGTISSAGHRRGAQMGVLRVDHPDIEEFVTVKNDLSKLTNFNISIAVTDKFMEAVKNDGTFDLVFDGTVYDTIRAVPLWDKIMRSTWDYAEPGLLFIDRINEKNNLYYCEQIAATNPCGEQPLPPYGACLLGSINLVKYVSYVSGEDKGFFNFYELEEDIPHIVRAVDNVIDRTIYPLEAQEQEAKDKRRMGIGVTGLANALSMLGHDYGTEGAKLSTDRILKFIRDNIYLASIDLAKEKGSFPKFDAEKFVQSGYCKTLDQYIRTSIQQYGIRNSHLISYAPTGTISLCADNISSGIEPVFMKSGTRTIRDFDGEREVRVDDYAWRNHGITPVTADMLTPDQHVDMLCIASKYTDSAVSKTCNIGADVTWQEFKDVYMKAYEGGASGCTTFRLSGKRFGIMKADDEPVEEKVEEKALTEGAACYIDPSTGVRTCDG